ncbi:hypothetical protein [Domibacillus indicus]|uniref:hypothetical protein n=1 Tax=Domibacillus indicus TaxID=1437523 RepID=UPI000617C1A3|nr:hypothetical protein [Domibacillus indicus]
MATERIRVGYVELTEEESARLLKEVQRDQQAETLEDLQEIMNAYDARMVEPDEDLLEEVIADAEGEPSVTEEEIEVFPKVENGKRYQIKASKKSNS